MIKELGITQEEMEHMSTLFNTEEKNRRARSEYNPEKRREKYKKQQEKDGKMLEKEKIENCTKKMKDLLAKGLSNQEIMQILKISKRTFYRYKTNIN